MLSSRSLNPVLKQLWAIRRGQQTFRIFDSASNSFGGQVAPSED